jgi:DNA-binding response OmpR family regulator
MRKIIILWVDDEMELLKPHILFLEDKGFGVLTSTNGDDAIHIASTVPVDLIFLDENMPGMSGLETLRTLKLIKPNVPVIMITKSEEEDIMDKALGSKISDYLIKPVNPNQILLTIKKYIDSQRLVSQTTDSDYRAEFSILTGLINSAQTLDQWKDIYSKLVYWEIEIAESTEQGMEEILRMQKSEANQGFTRFIKSNYNNWFDDKNPDMPLLSHNVFRDKVFPLVNSGNKVILILIDNLRLDQWRVLYRQMSDYFVIDNDELYCGILPSVTQYARNALFAGLMPMEIEEFYPDLWINDEEDETKNQYEEELLRKQMQRHRNNGKLYYEKVNNQRAGKKLVENYKNLLSYDLSVIVVNFVDVLSHSRTDMEVIRELAGDEAAYRSLTISWFQHSNLFELIKLLSGQKIKLIITTDHGSIRVFNPVKVIGDKKTSSNLRYKLGRNLNYNPREVFEIRQPGRIHLPRINLTSSYIFACNNDFLVYPNNYNHFANFYRNTFQHGGISLEELLIPLAVMSPK